MKSGKHSGKASQIQIMLNELIYLFVTYTIIQSIMRSEMCSLKWVFNPSKWSSGQPTVCGARGAVVGFGALLKGLTSVVDTSCQSRDSNPQPGLPRVSSLRSIRP